MTTSIEEALRSGAWRLVPVEASEEMHEAGYDATRLPDGTPQFADAGFCLGHAGPIYKAMLSASPDHTPALVALIEERDRLKVERDALRGVLSGLSSYLGAGLGDDATTAEQFDRRIREGIEITYAPMVEAWRKEMAR